MLARLKKLDSASKNKLSIAIAFVTTLCIALSWFGYKYVYIKQSSQSHTESLQIGEMKKLLEENVSEIKRQWSSIRSASTRKETQ